MITIQELEKILATYKINKPRTRVSETENKFLPSLSTFVDLIINDIPPTQETFITTFKSNHPELKMHGILSRLKRAYLSYVREYHLGFILRKYFEIVIYDLQTDMLGVDYTIIYKDDSFYIHAFVNTENGRYWRSIKNSRHIFKGQHIDLPLDLNKGKRVGKFIFYTHKQVIELKSTMDEIIKQNSCVKKEIQTQDL
jgi:hypothetical protein